MLSNSDFSGILWVCNRLLNLCCYGNWSGFTCWQIWASLQACVDINQSVYYHDVKHLHSSDETLEWTSSMNGKSVSNLLCIFACNRCKHGIWSLCRIYWQTLQFPDAAQQHHRSTLLSWGHRRRPGRSPELLHIPSNICGICWWASPWSQRGLRRGSSTFWGLFAAERLYILQVIPEPAVPEKCFYGRKWGLSFSKWSKGAVSISCEWAGCRNKECLCAHLLCQRSNVKMFPRFLTVWAPFACLLHFYLCSSLLGIDTHRHSRLWAI